MTANTLSDPVDYFLEVVDRDHRRFCRIADRIESEPGLLRIPLANIERWINAGHSSRQRLEGWQKKIEAAMCSPSEFEALTRLLRDPSPDAVQWKGFSPFAGIPVEET